MSLYENIHAKKKRGEKMSLYENIHAKRKRGEKMRKKGAKGAPKIGTFKKIAAKQKKKKGKKNGKKVS